MSDSVIEDIARRAAAAGVFDPDVRDHVHVCCGSPRQAAIERFINRMPFDLQWMIGSIRELEDELEKKR